MAADWLQAAARAMFRWYLSKFPLRDGKAYFYQRLHTPLLPAARYLTVMLDKGFRMQLDLEDAEQRKIYFYGHYHERYEARLVEQLLDDGGVFWDIGAHVGYFSLVAATALKNRGQVVAFEPGSVAYARLAENIALNPYTNVKLYNLAVSNRDGEAVLYLAGETADSSASLYGHGHQQARREVCRTVSLDRFLREEGLHRPDLVKIDVEGAELAVLQGAAQMIAASPPLLLVEMEEKNLKAAGASKAAIHRFLTAFGYRAAFLRKGRWHPVTDISAAPGRNIFWFNPALPTHRLQAARLSLPGS